MAAHTTFTNSDAKIKVSAEKRELSELQKIQIMLGLWDGVLGSPVETRALPEWNWVPNDEWRSLEGSLSDHPEHDTSKMKADDRAWEEEHNARKFGYSRER